MLLKNYKFTDFDGIQDDEHFKHKMWFSNLKWKLKVNSWLLQKGLRKEQLRFQGTRVFVCFNFKRSQYVGIFVFFLIKSRGTSSQNWIVAKIRMNRDILLVKNIYCTLKFVAIHQVIKIAITYLVKPGQESKVKALMRFFELERAAGIPMKMVNSFISREQK